MVENTINTNILQKIVNNLNNNQNINCVYDYVYKTNDYDPQKINISRNRWKVVLEKYINQSEQQKTIKKTKHFLK